MSSYKIEKSDEEWRALLGVDRYEVLRHSATEAPFSGELNHVEGAGEFVCAGCGIVLFTSTAKFDSGCGWPSFDAPSGPIEERSDTSLWSARTEVLCGNCGGHLGHVFDDGPTASGLRYCINSLSLEYNQEDTSA
jgi:peptide-methionine (R)-S-oxide reductase